MNQVLKLGWQIANKNTRQEDQEHNDNSNTVTTGDDGTRLQALALINDCYKYVMDLTKWCHNNRCYQVYSGKQGETNVKKEDNGSKESKETDYDKDKDQLEEKQEEETGELDEQETTTNKVF